MLESNYCTNHDEVYDEGEKTFTSFWQALSSGLHGLGEVRARAGSAAVHEARAAGC